MEYDGGFGVVSTTCATLIRTVRWCRSIEAGGWAMVRMAGGNVMVTRVCRWRLKT